MYSNEICNITCMLRRDFDQVSDARLTSVFRILSFYVLLSFATVLAIKGLAAAS